jgi:hypothetical protein
MDVGRELKVTWGSREAWYEKGSRDGIKKGSVSGREKDALRRTEMPGRLLSTVR